jgi:hypothetical protein
MLRCNTHIIALVVRGQPIGINADRWSLCRSAKYFALVARGQPIGINIDR